MLIRNARAIICDSECTKRDVESYYNVKDKPLYVVPVGFNKQKFYPRDRGITQERLGLTNYLLYVGSFQAFLS